MDVSVIIPCWNEERHLARCLDALLAQTLPGECYEVILVDNLSTDRSVAIARRYPAVSVVQETRRSSYAARNTGVRLARGRILAFTDADCEVCPEWIERIRAALADGRTAALVGGRRFARETLVLRNLADYELEKARYVFAQDDASLYYAYTNNMAIRREVFDRAGPFVEIARGGDVILLSKVIAASGCDAVRFVPDILIRHLEIDRWYSWHRKMWIYGRSYQNYHPLSRTRPLSYRDRLAILLSASRRSEFPLLHGLLLMVSGVMATLAFEAGRRYERWRTRSRS